VRESNVEYSPHGDGVIVNVSSVNGHVAFPVISAYVATKFALEGLSESIAYELSLLESK
jgi:short-subunit dehydrogenase